MHGRCPEAKVNFVRPIWMIYMTFSRLASMEAGLRAIETESGLKGIAWPQSQSLNEGIQVKKKEFLFQNYEIWHARPGCT